MTTTTATGPGETDTGAALLATAEAASWAEHPVIAPVPFSEFDAFVERAAAAAGVDVRTPFVFRVEGTPARLDWHVLDADRIPAGAHGHEAHLATAVRGSLEGSPARVVGFYSRGHHGVFTHHDSNSHLHVVTTAPSLTGHVDRLDLGPGTRLLFPSAPPSPQP